jgi:hypothetical protein
MKNYQTIESATDPRIALIEETLSDGSKVYGLRISTGNGFMFIDSDCEHNARTLFEQFAGPAHTIY